MLDQLGAEDFAGEVGQRFAVVGAAAPVALELISAQPNPRGARPGRIPFALLFRAPAAFGAAQGTYRLAHPRLGELEIFMVPVGATEQSVDYEAVFN